MHELSSNTTDDLDHEWPFSDEEDDDGSDESLDREDPIQKREYCTEVEVFLDKRVRETRQTERGNTRGGATKKREISRTLLSINLHFSVDP